MISDIKKITAIIPCYNEERGIADVIQSFPRAQLLAHGYTLEILVVDNNSKDRTGEIARSLGATVLHEPMKGKGNAMRLGFRSISPDTDYVVMLDGDATYRPEEILRIVEPLRSGFCNVIIGSRLGGKITEGSMPAFNRAGNWMYSMLVRIFYRANVTDVLTGYFAWTREAINRLHPHLVSNGFAIEMEMVTKMAILGEQIYSVPITYDSRAGHSNLSPVRDGIKILWMFAKNFFWRPHPTWGFRNEVPGVPVSGKNILCISHYYPPHMGGLELVAYQQAKRLVESGNSVTVVTSRVTSKERSGVFEGIRVLRIYALNIFERWGIPFPIFSPTLLFILMRETRKADVVHIHDSFYMSSFIGALCARWYNKPIVLMQHVAMINHPSSIVMLVQRIVYLTVGKYIFSASGRIVTLNDRVEQFLKNMGAASEKFVALSNGVDSNLFYPPSEDVKKMLRKKFNLSIERKIVLFVGRFVPKKGFFKLLGAQSDEYQIVFCGGDIPKHANDNVVFLGKLPHHETAEVYKVADVFVLPSEDEGFPLSVQEAMATGLPIITTNDSGYGRYNFDKKLIYLVDNPTEESVRDAIRSIIHDEARLKEMSSYSRKYATEYFSWPGIIHKLVGVYDALTA